MLIDFNDFRPTASRRNLTLVDCKFAHLTWENVTQYLVKNKVVHKFESTLFPSKKVGGSENNRLCCVEKYMEAMLQRVFKVTTLCIDTRSQSFPPLVNGLIHDAVLQSSPRPNKPLLKNDFFDIP